MAKSMTQKDAVLYHLQHFGSLTPAQAYEDYGIMRLSAVIFDLKKLGYDINTELVGKTNRFGDTVYIAKYSLRKKNV